MSVDSLKRDRRRFGDALFKRVATASGSGILVILAAVALFLIGLSLPALFASAEDLPYGPFWSWVIPLALGTVWAAALVLAVMVLPIITAISREVFLQTPRLHEEASLALGATRWEMIRQAVLPFATPGIVSACMLGLGRALGETMAVAMVLSPGAGFHLQLLTSSNPNSIAANIALQFPEAYGLGVNQLIASGLILFVITLGVNMAARAIVARRAEFSGAN